VVVLNRIYTRTGDDGTTALGSGERLKKYNLRIESYGTVDEANAAIGMARIHLGGKPAELDVMLLRIQNDMFDLGADLCVPDKGEKLPYEPLRITDAQVTRLETEIDQLNKPMSPLRSFVLPGGSAGAAALHVARTITRRAERIIVELADQPGEPVSSAAIKFVNRLSDFLFVASRYVNDQGKADVLWVPGKNR
jgi:cob(I)alamin adenosyltransferase